MTSLHGSYLRFRFSNAWIRVPRWVAKKLLMNNIGIDAQLGKQTKKVTK